MYLFETLWGLNISIFVTGFGLSATFRLCLMETSSEKDSLPDKTYFKDENQQSNTTPGTEKHKIIGWISRRKSTLAAELSPIINRKQL